MLNSLESSRIIEEIVAYNLQAPIANYILVCLIPQNLCECALEGRFVTDGDFKIVGSEDIAKAKSLVDAVKLKAVQSFDRKSEPKIKEIRVAVKSDINQMDQGIDCDVILKTTNRKGESVSTTIKGDFDEKTKTWIYPVNETMTFDKSLYYQLLSAISVDVQVVYA